MHHLSVPDLPEVADASSQPWPPQEAHLVLASLPSPFISMAAFAWPGPAGPATPQSVPSAPVCCELKSLSLDVGLALSS